MQQAAGFAAKRRPRKFPGPQATIAVAVMAIACSENRFTSKRLFALLGFAQQSVD
jgi:hypothetical protein